LSRHNNHVWGLHIASAGRYLLNEGAEFTDVYSLLERAGEHTGNPERMAACLVAYIVSISTGLDQAKRTAISGALGADRIEYGRHQVIRDFLTCFEPLYQGADLATLCAIAGGIAARPPRWLTIRMPMGLRLLGQMRPAGATDAAECLDDVVIRIKAAAPRLSRTVSTVHKAKGLEFDHVLIANFSSGHFGDDELSRRIAYVALSRARESVTFLVPERNPSPLLPGR
jgi:DNA helicase-2/ATP-dependent DNA helicase PcrA